MKFHPSPNLVQIIRNTIDGRTQFLEMKVLWQHGNAPLALLLVEGV
jgi:hypothetical protein